MHWLLLLSVCHWQAAQQSLCLITWTSALHINSPIPIDTGSRMCFRKNVHYLIFYNLKKPGPIFVNFAPRNIQIILATESDYNSYHIQRLLVKNLLQAGCLPVSQPTDFSIIFFRIFKHHGLIIIIIIVFIVKLSIATCYTVYGVIKCTT